MLGNVMAPGGKAILNVTYDPARIRGAQYLKSNFNWHIDGHTPDIPAKATVLTARHVAMAGGGTEFANTYVAYENMPELERKRYEGLRVVHSFEATQRGVIAERGTHQELLARNGLYASMWNRQREAQEAREKLARVAEQDEAPNRNPPEIVDDGPPARPLSD